MHIYAFGSVCRGDISPDSDVDLLAIVDEYDARLTADCYSIYSYQRICELWHEGNPFAWHLSLESKLLFSSNRSDLFQSMGPPMEYRHGNRDCEKFYALFREARRSMDENDLSTAFDLSTIFLAIRNIATCFSLGILRMPTFSRHSARQLGEHSLSMPEAPYTVLERARILCTRGLGDAIIQNEVNSVRSHIPLIDEWMKALIVEAQRHA
jgi:hypothetical protein